MKDRLVIPGLEEARTAGRRSEVQRCALLTWPAHSPRCALMGATNRRSQLQNKTLRVGQSAHMANAALARYTAGAPEYRTTANYSRNLKDGGTSDRTNFDLFL
jgi:hypothetical protein